MTLRQFCRITGVPVALLVLSVLTTSCVSSGKRAQPAAGEKSKRAQWEARLTEKQRTSPAFAYVEEDPALPRVLLIGDSISIGYTPETRRLLAGRANVLRIPTNAGPTTRGLESIDEWLGGEHWDVIHFNWGLHDLKRMKDGKMDVSADNQVPPEQYRTNLDRLVVTLEATGAKLVWANTTPVPEGAAGRIPGDDVQYNAIAAEVMQKHGVVTNDLYAAVLPHLDPCQQPANVHFTSEGSAFLASHAANAILDALGIVREPRRVPAPDAKVEFKQVQGKDGKPGTLSLHLFHPEGFNVHDSRSCIVFFFGGGWRSGSPSQFYNQSDYLASRGMVAVCAEYRTEKGHGAPPWQCVEDGKSAVRYLREHAAELGIDPGRIAVSGGSAGGHVAAATATVQTFDAPGDHLDVSCRPDALVLFNAVFDNGPEGYGYDRVQDFFPAISPLHNIREGLPPTLVLLGDHDKLIPVSTAYKYKKRMEECGNRCEVVIYPGQQHGFFNRGRTSSEGKAAFVDTVRQADRFLAALGFLTSPPTIEVWEDGMKAIEEQADRGKRRASR